MKLIAGLGNPGKEYENTRHNSGFLAIDMLAEKCNVSIAVSKFNALTASVRIDDTPVLLMKPLTYMNESGQAVNQAVAYYHIEPEDILIIHDDMDLEVGSVRIRTSGSSGGQKGMRSIQQAVGTEAISRIRIGVGHGRRDHVPDWVLSPISSADKEKYQAALKDASEAAYAWVNEPIQTVMNKYNKKAEKEAE
ncbi:MAG: aminoacyl-tRNA hydrolase [Erysipelotrichia bacterium]|nr:aminoacyl-tRNA hydrolase [Erysipelotrichia bacterium]